MKKTFDLFLALVLFLAAGAAWAEGDSPTLFSLGYYQFYGTPLQPQALAQSTRDGLGFEVLGEFNPSYYVSVGLDF